jgi:hypothetical protein
MHPSTNRGPVTKRVLSLYALDPAMPVLLRLDGAVQVGWDLRRAVLVRPPRGLAAAELATLPMCPIGYATAPHCR